MDIKKHKDLVTTAPKKWANLYKVHKRKYQDHGPLGEPVEQKLLFLLACCGGQVRVSKGDVVEMQTQRTDLLFCFFSTSKPCGWRREPSAVLK